MAGNVGVCCFQLVDETKRCLLACFGQVDVDRFLHIENSPDPGKNCLPGSHDQRGRTFAERLAESLFPPAPTRARKLLK